MPKFLDSRIENGKHISVRYRQHHLAGWYFRRAAFYAARCADLLPRFPQALSEDELAIVVESSLLTLIFSALAAEGCVNELGEEVIEDAKLKDFLDCRGEFRAAKGVGQITWKWKKLFECRQVLLDVSAAPLARLDELIKARNQFVHYRPTDYAAKAIYERSSEEMKLPGMFMIWDAGEQPTRIEPSAIQRELTPHRAINHYSAARAVLSEWYKTVGAGAEKVDELAPALVVREAQTSS